MFFIEMSKEKHERSERTQPVSWALAYSRNRPYAKVTQYTLVFIPCQLSCKFNLKIGVSSAIFTLHLLPTDTLLPVCPSPPLLLSLSLSLSLSLCLSFFCSPSPSPPLSLSFSISPILSDPSLSLCLLSRAHRASLRNVRQRSPVNHVLSIAWMTVMSSRARPQDGPLHCRGHGSIMTGHLVQDRIEKLAPVSCGFDLCWWRLCLSGLWQLVNVCGQTTSTSWSEEEISPGLNSVFWAEPPTKHTWKQW